MKYLAILLLLILPSISYANELIELKVDGYNIKALKLTKNTGYKLIVGVSEKGESLESMVTRYGGISGVNGAYFCPKDYKNTCPKGNVTWADRISNGVSYSATPDDTGTERTIFALDKDQNPFLFRKAHDYSRGRSDEYVTGKNINFDKKKDIYNGIGNYPLLLEKGISKIGESKLVDSKMKEKTLKNFICSNKEGNVVLMGGVEKISMLDLPALLARIGCYDSINLDAGSSTAMMHNKKNIIKGGRDIMDAWIIIPDKNYPIKPDYSKDPDVQRTVENFKKVLEFRYAKLDDLSRKQKMYALSSRLSSIIIRIEVGSKKRVILEGIKKYVDSYVQ